MFPRAWASEHCRPVAHYLDTMYDFEDYYKGCMDPLKGHTNTKEDPIPVRGWEVARDVDNTVSVKWTTDPADGKPYRGADGTPHSQGHIVLKFPPHSSKMLKILEPAAPVLCARYRKQLSSSKMRNTMKAEDMLESLDWLQLVAETGRVPIDEVL